MKASVLVDTNTVSGAKLDSVQTGGTYKVQACVWTDDNGSQTLTNSSSLSCQQTILKPVR